jgi:AbrB family looped-hinge helix DNA binding protein
MDAAKEYGQISGKGRVTIPKRLRERLGLEEGDTVMFSVKEGRLVLVPMSLVPRDQVWFYSEEMQERVARAEAEIAAGETTRVRSPEEAEALLAELED